MSVWMCFSTERMSPGSRKRAREGSSCVNLSKVSGRFFPTWIGFRFAFPQPDLHSQVFAANFSRPGQHPRSTSLLLGVIHARPHLRSQQLPADSWLDSSALPVDSSAPQALRTPFPQLTKPQNCGRPGSGASPGTWEDGREERRCGWRRQRRARVLLTQFTVETGRSFTVRQFCHGQELPCSSRCVYLRFPTKVPLPTKPLLCALSQRPEAGWSLHACQHSNPILKSAMISGMTFLKTKYMSWFASILLASLSGQAASDGV